MNNPANHPENTLPALIDAARAGDQAACAAIYELFVRATYRLAYGVLLDAHDAEEVVQDSFAYAFHNLGRFDPARSSFRTWLYTITMSRCRNKRRRKWLPTIALSDLVEFLPGPGPHPETVIEQHGIREIVLDALRRLSPKLREAVVLRYFDGLTYREMAAVLNCPQKTAESRVRLAHEALYDILSEQRDSLLEGVFGQ
jgi:RNA polymerase sigma-70 factor (ECF subfamily)